MPATRSALPLSLSRLLRSMIPPALSRSFLFFLGFVFFLGIVAPLVVAVGAAAEQCSKEHREVQFNREGVLRLREYNCQRGAGTLSIQFHRLSAMAASMLLEGERARWVSDVFGPHDLADNAVGREFKKILREFGYQSLSDDYKGETVLAISVDTPLGGVGTEQPRVIENESFRFHGLPSFGDMPMPNEMLHVRDRASWPNGFRFFYSGVLRHLYMARRFGGTPRRQTLNSTRSGSKPTTG